MQVSLKNMSCDADELINKLKAEQEEKNKKSEKKETKFEDNKFRPELIGQKTTYVLRVLPHIFVKDGNAEPWVNTHVHMFNNAVGQKKFVLCPRTVGIGGTKTTPCPLCEKSRSLFDKVNAKTASKAEEELASKLYAKPRYFVNVLVVEDPRPADKNQKGKVLIFEFGPQIFEKFTETLVDQKKKFYLPQNGYNFNLVVKKKGDYTSYETSYFAESSSPVATSDEEFDRITKGIKDLTKFAFGKPAKSYDDIKLIMEGKEPVKTEKTWDSHTNQTTQREMGRPEIDETVSLPEAPSQSSSSIGSTSATSTESPKRLSDDDLLASLDSLQA